MDNFHFVNVAVRAAYIRTLFVHTGHGQFLTKREKEDLLKVPANNISPLKERILACDWEFRAFDTLGLINAILSGWTPVSVVEDGPPGYVRKYCVPLEVLDACVDVTDDFDLITPGEIVYRRGYVGIYVGNGEVVEASLKWDCAVQISKLSGDRGDHVRKWELHGKLKDLEYIEQGVVLYPTGGEVAVSAKPSLWQRLKQLFRKK